MADRTTRTTQTRARFLDLLSESGNVRASCAALGLQRSTIYEWRCRDQDFADAWDAALQLGAEGLEDEARRRAMAGSDYLLAFMLRSLKPEKYRELKTINANQTTGFDYRLLPVDELRRRLDALRGEQDGPILALPSSASEL